VDKHNILHTLFYKISILPSCEIFRFSILKTLIIISKPQTIAMKVLAFLLTLFIAASAQAKIWRVNNNVGIAADFTTIQNAHNAAANGDTLYLEGSNTSYGALTSSKQLVIIGPGYFLDQIPNSQVGQLTAKVDNVTLNVGAGGTLIMGVDFYGSTLTLNCNDVTIRKNKFSSTSGTDPLYYYGLVRLNHLNNNGSNPGVSNIIIAQNIGLYIEATKPSTNILITNNILGYSTNYGDATTNGCIDGGQNTVMLIQNNVIRRGRLNVYGSTITNNIMVAGSLAANNNLYSNNIGSGTQFGTDNGNQSNVAMTTVFTGTGAPDEAYKLKAGSPAIGAGYGSLAGTPIDCGIYSGSLPYIVAGQVNMPVIYFFNNQPIGSNTDPIKVNVKVRATGN
jgi:hypothetical protein